MNDQLRTTRRNKATAAAEKTRKNALDEARRAYNEAMMPVLAKYREDMESAEGEYERSKEYIRRTFY